MPSAPFTPVFMQRDGVDPVGEVARLRAEEPVARVETVAQPGHGSGSAWLVTRYEDVRDVLGAADRFSSTRQRTLAVREGDPAPPRSAGILIHDDPPEHTRVRRLLAPEFAPSRMRRLRPRITAIVTEVLDKMERMRPPVDLVTNFALPIPSLVICELIGVPYEDRKGFQRRSAVLVNLRSSLEEKIAAATESHEYMAALIARQREQPNEGLLGMLIREHRGDLSDEDLAGIGTLMMLAGQDNVTSMIGVSSILLLRHPDQLALLRDSEHEQAVDHAVEELLRYASVVHIPTPRTAVTDTKVAGQPIKAGEEVLCSLSAANRDDVLGEGADRLDLTRKPVSHVAFGYGAHYCLGAPLARLELRIALSALLRRFPDLRLAVPFEEIRFRHTMAFGVESLPVTWNRDPDGE